MLAVSGGTFQNHYASSPPLSKTDKRRWQEADLETVCSVADNGAIAEWNWSGIGAVQGFASARPICSVIGRFLLRRRALWSSASLWLVCTFVTPNSLNYPIIENKTIARRKFSNN